MEKRYSNLNVLRGASVTAVALLTLVLLAILPQPGYRTSRLVLFAIVIAVGWVGAAGAVWGRFGPTIAGAIGLVLLGFWQFTIGLILLPTAVILLITALLAREEASRSNQADSTPTRS